MGDRHPLSRRQEVMNRKNVGCPERKAFFTHHAGESRRECVVILPRLPNGDGGEICTFTNTDVKDEPRRRRHGRPAAPTFIVLLCGHCGRLVDNSYRHVCHLFEAKTDGKIIHGVRGCLRDESRHVCAGQNVGVTQLLWHPARHLHA